MNDNNNQSVESGNKSSLTALPRVVKGGDESLIKKAWNNFAPTRAFALGAILTATVTNLYYSREADMVQNSQDEQPMIFHPQPDGTVYIEQGNNLAVGFNGITCPVPFGYPKDKALAIGSKSDAAINPVDESFASTLAGTLGVVRDVTITEKPSEKSEELMRDLYAYSKICMDNLLLEKQVHNETNTPPAVLEHN
jgi:hypothetical protein